MSTFTFQAPNTEVHVIAYNKQSYYKLADIMEGLTLISEEDTMARLSSKAFTKFPRNSKREQATYLKGDWLPNIFELCRNRKAIEFMKFMNREVIPAVNKSLVAERAARKASRAAKTSAQGGAVLKAETLPPQAELPAPAFQPQQLSLPIDKIESRNPVRKFVNEQFGELRVIEKDGQPWFVGKDVAGMLGYGEGKSLANAIANHVDDEDKGVTKMMTPGGTQNMIIINQSGLYSLILSSKLPAAKQFKHWVTSEVLPAIGRDNGYVAGEEKMNDDELILQAMLVLKKKLEMREAENATLQQYNAELSNQIETNAPKVAFADAVEDRGENLGLAAFAKLLYDDETPVGRTRLIRWLRANGYFIQDAPLPYQRYIENGYFTIRLKELPNGNVATVTLITPRGQLALTNAFKKLAQLA